MKKTICAALACVLCLVLLPGCAPTSYHDGTYTAQFKEYDSYGYKDTLTITVKDGAVVAIVYDGVNAAGGLKSEDSEYRANMEERQGTYPSKYQGDLANQYLASGDIEYVVNVAGATDSSKAFKLLFEALAASMASGSTDVVLVDNPSAS